MAGGLLGGLMAGIGQGIIETNKAYDAREFEAMRNQAEIEKERRIEEMLMRREGREAQANTEQQKLKAGFAAAEEERRFTNLPREAEYQREMANAKYIDKTTEADKQYKDLRNKKLQYDIDNPRQTNTGRMPEIDKLQLQELNKVIAKKEEQSSALASATDTASIKQKKSLDSELSTLKNQANEIIVRSGGVSSGFGSASSNVNKADAISKIRFYNGGQAQPSNKLEQLKQELDEYNRMESSGMR